MVFRCKKEKLLNVTLKRDCGRITRSFVFSNGFFLSFKDSDFVVKKYF